MRIGIVSWLIRDVERRYFRLIGIRHPAHLILRVPGTSKDRDVVADARLDVRETRGAIIIGSALLDDIHLLPAGIDAFAEESNLGVRNGLSLLVLNLQSNVGCYRKPKDDVLGIDSRSRYDSGCFLVVLFVVSLGSALR